MEEIKLKIENYLATRNNLMFGERQRGQGFPSNKMTCQKN